MKIIIDKKVSGNVVEIKPSYNSGIVSSVKKSKI